MSTRTILLVDRDPLQRQLVDMLLAEDGHHIVNAGSGREALEYLKAHTPHLVVMEIALPDVGGDVVCRKLKSVSRLSRVPVILTSEPRARSGASADLKDVARAVGADLYLPKPLGDKNVRERVRQLLGRWETPAAPPKKTMKNTVILEEALVDLEAGKADAVPTNAVTDAIYQENEELRREVASLKRRLARFDAALPGRNAGTEPAVPEGFVPGAEPSAPQAMPQGGPAAEDGGDPVEREAAEGAADSGDAARDETAGGEASGSGAAEGDLAHRVRDLERRNKALLAALEAAKAELESVPRGLFGRRRHD